MRRTSVGLTRFLTLLEIKTIQSQNKSKNYSLISESCLFISLVSYLLFNLYKGIQREKHKVNMLDVIPLFDFTTSEFIASVIEILE
jgi:hypothetical protein